MNIEDSNLTKANSSSPNITPSSQALGKTPFSFRGSAAEYFGIWITNLLLTIVTLGFYAPWAKVRRLRYFYGNSYLADRHFDFTANPVRILIGRLIVIGSYLLLVGLIALPVITSQAKGELANVTTFSMVLRLVLVFAFILIIPWMIRSTYRFTARNSKLSNIRFHFKGALGSAYGTYILGFLVTFFSLGILFPVAVWLYKRYQLNNLHLGQIKFDFNSSIWDYFKAIVGPFVVFLIALFVAALPLISQISQGVPPAFISPLIMLPLSVVYIFGLLVISPLIQASLFKATWNKINVGRNLISTRLGVWKYTWIFLSNAVVMVLSLGLLVPWAAVRMYRYKLESMQVDIQDDLNQLENTAQHDANAIAEEFTDIFDIDVSL